MDIEQTNLIKRDFLSSWYSFVNDDISDRFLLSDTEFQEICKAIVEDPEFIFTFDKQVGKNRFIAKQALYHWFVKLNLRLASSQTYELTERKMVSHMNDLCLDGGWGNIPLDYIKFGQELGLVCHLDLRDKYSFPLAYIISFLSKSGMKAAKNYLTARTYSADIVPGFQELISGQLRSELAQLNDIQRYVIIRRQGLMGFGKQTLEEIGQQLNLTRERIRQIEDKCWAKIWHSSNQPRFVRPLLICVLNREGSLLVYPETIQQEIKFICKCLSVPFWEFPFVNIWIMGGICASVNLPENVWTDLSNINTTLKEFLSNLPLSFNQDDIETLSQMLFPFVMKRLDKTQKVYLALKQIGKPAHFSEVTTVYADLFPGKYPSEHSIHALLLREKHGVVWIGSKGMFALEEWGYTRPTCSLTDTIADIVEEKYRDTGAPVPLIVIQAEIGKYRKIINANSIILASCFNPRLTVQEDFSFVPRIEVNEEKELPDFELDKLLRKFEEKMR